MRAGVVITGLIIFMIALIASITLFIVGVATMQDPADEAYAKVTISGPVVLESGDYVLWSDEEDVEVTVNNQFGDEIDVNDMGFHASDTHGNQYIGTITIDSDGIYTITKDSATATIYFQKSGDVQLQGFFMGCGCCCGLLFVPLGLLILIVGLFLKKK